MPRRQRRRRRRTRRRFINEQTPRLYSKRCAVQHTIHASNGVRNGSEIVNVVFRIVLVTAVVCRSKNIGQTIRIVHTCAIPERNIRYSPRTHYFVPTRPHTRLRSR